MQIQVLLFASLKDVAGKTSFPLEVPSGTQAKQLTALIVAAEPGLAPWLPLTRLAINMDYALPDTVLKDGDEVALIPPVSGGVGLFEIRTQALSLDEVVQAVQGQAGHSCGAICTFLGVVRGNSRDPQGNLHEDISYLDYEAFAPMAQKQLALIGQEIYQKFGGYCAITHRVGRLHLGEASVAIAVASAHRPQAFEGCRYAIEEIKKRVPVWKKESAGDGTWWVEGSPDYEECLGTMELSEE